MFSGIYAAWNWLFQPSADLWWTEAEARIDQVVEVGREWRVWYHASSWKARSLKYIELHPGDLVKIVRRKGITLWVEPMETEQQ